MNMGCLYNARHDWFLFKTPLVNIEHISVQKREHKDIKL